MGTANKARRSGAVALAAAMVVSTLAVVATPAGAESNLPVPVSVTLMDALGEPVVGYVLCTDAYSNCAMTDGAGLAVLQVAPNTDVPLSLPVVRTGGGAVDDAPLVVAAGPTGAAVTVRMPSSSARAYRVVDPDGRPVMGVWLDHRLLVSTAVDDPTYGVYRLRETYGLLYHPSEFKHVAYETSSNGLTPPVTWFAYEPDPAIACSVVENPLVCDADQDGTVDGLVLRWSSGTERRTPIPYTTWATSSTGTVTLTMPAVPIVEVVDQRPGTRPGDGVITVRVRRPVGASYVPAQNMRLTVAPNVAPGLYSSFLAETTVSGATTDSRGMAEIHVHHLAAPMTVSVTSVENSVADVVTVKVRRGIAFRTVQYHARGHETKRPASLNGEYVTLTNTTSKRVSLRGWSIRNRDGDRYTFGRYTLRPGARVVVHTGPGKNTRTDRYWGRREHVWRNRGDKATLLRPSGAVVTTCIWEHRPGGYDSCVAPTFIA